jgi:hypothetical protein
MDTKLPSIPLYVSMIFFSVWILYAIRRNGFNKVEYKLNYAYFFLVETWQGFLLNVLKAIV